MLSGFIVLFVIAFLQMIIHFVLPLSSTTGTTTFPDLIRTIFNYISILAGTVGIFLIPIGIVVGIVKLSRS
jgi:hypothetical protein